MYDVFSYIYHKNQPNVGKYIIHGSYGVQKNKDQGHVGRHTHLITHTYGLDSDRIYGSLSYIRSMDINNGKMAVKYIPGILSWVASEWIVVFVYEKS